MSWLQIALIAWLAGHVIIPPVLYFGYGFCMAAKTSRDKGLSPEHVYKIDLALAVPVILLDGAYNALWLSVLCLDLQPKNSFRMIDFKGVRFPFFELVTERLSRYNETPSEWVWRRWVARTVAPFLDGKDPKGWHVRQQVKT